MALTSVSFSWRRRSLVVSRTARVMFGREFISIILRNLSSIQSARRNFEDRGLRGCHGCNNGFLNRRKRRQRSLRLVPPKESLCPLCWFLLAEEALGTQIFNFCGLRSFPPVNSNTPGLVGQGVHFFRTPPPMRAA